MRLLAYREDVPGFELAPCNVRDDFYRNLRTENCAFCESKTFFSSRLTLCYVTKKTLTQNVILNFASVIAEASILILRSSPQSRY